MKIYKIRILVSLAFLWSFLTSYGQLAEAGRSADMINVTPTGAFVYNIPIATPPGIKDVVPQVALTFSSQSGEGVAGYGWHIAGTSAITKVPATLEHDGFNDPVDGDDNDRYALDGQRLILKSGVYGQHGSTYVTETFSNLIIEAIGSDGGQPRQFKVIDGAGNRMLYGGDSTTKDGLSWNLTLKDNSQRVYVSYSYKKSPGQILLNEIKYGSRVGDTPPYTIKFNYEDKDYIPVGSYFGGIRVANSSILKSVEVFTNKKIYRKYTLEHSRTDNKYYLLNKVTESNAEGKKLPPIILSYDQPASGTLQAFKAGVGSSTLHPSIDIRNYLLAAGDFNGDGKMDIVMEKDSGPYEQYLYTNVTSGNNATSAVSIGRGRRHAALFAGTILVNNKLLSRQGIISVNETGEEVVFETKWNNSTAGFGSYAKSWPSTLIDDRGCNGKIRKAIPHTYYPGDFNGDGITDVIAIEKGTIYSRCDFDRSNPDCVQPGEGGPPSEGDCCVCRRQERPFGFTVSYVDLNPNVEEDFYTTTSQFVNDFTKDARVLTGDFDGDGTTNLYVLNPGRITVYGLSDKNELVRLRRRDIPWYDTELPIYTGDFNGDGLTDLIQPEGDKNFDWNYYIAGGNEFYWERKTLSVQFLKNKLDQDPKSDSKRDLALFEYHYTVEDINNDGKSDIIEHHIVNGAEGSSTNFEDIFIHRNTGETDNSFQGFAPNFEFVQHHHQENFGTQPEGVPIVFDANIRTINPEYVYLDLNNFFFYDLPQDTRAPTRLRNVANNQLETSIFYTSEEMNISGNGVYFKGGAPDYPLATMASMAGVSVVERLVQTTPNNKKRYRDFRYQGLTNHM